MTRATRFALALLAATPCTLALTRPAQAEAPSTKAQPVYVLTLSTDDSDDQAEALTQAMRSRVRQVQGWSLLESAQSFDTLAIALKCPPRPDAGCLSRIADQLHADHFVWGTLSKGPKAGEVNALVHMWTRGRGDETVSEAYSDNLKDASDESLRAIAVRLFGKLTGGVVGGTLVVHAGDGGGVVMVDGAQKGRIEGGVARIEAPSGAHTITVRVPGFEAAPQTASVAVGGEQDLTFALSPSSAAGGDGATKSAFPMRKVLAYSALVVGGGLLIVSGVETAAWINDSNQSNTDRQNVSKTVGDVCQNGSNTAAVDACRRSKDATTVSTLGWVFGGLGAGLVGTGVILLLTDHSSTENPPTSAKRTAPKPKVDVLPAIGPLGGTVDLRVTF
jgi:hypothetical protein